MLHHAIVIASIKNQQTTHWVFEGLEVSYAVEIDPQADHDEQSKQALAPFFENLKKLLRTKPRGTRVINNRKNYSILIEKINWVASN